MIRFAGLIIGLSGLVLILNTTPSWGQTPTCSAPGCNPTASDENGNTAGGTHALLNVVSGSSGGFGNSAFGNNALVINTTGGHNTATGTSALYFNTTGEGNTATGVAALYNNNGHFNTASGYHALINNLDGSYNTASGNTALYSNTSGHDNTASGNEALYANTTGSFNTASGADALPGNTTGNNNTATGDNALFFNTTGSGNTASGSHALHFNTTGSDNTASGNTALAHNTTGIRNTALGTNALMLSTGNKNIAIGFQAGNNLTSGNNNIYLGSHGGDSTEYQTMRLGKAQTRTFIAGIATASVSDATVMIDTTTGQLGIATSSARYKQDIAPMGSRSEKVLELRPVTFAYKNDAQGTTHYGLVAEEVAAVYPELVTHTATGEVQAVRYQELIPMLLNELQRQRQELAELRALVARGGGAEAVIPGTDAAVGRTVSSPR